MRKFFISMASAVVSLAGFAQTGAENIGSSQLLGLSPQPGTIDLETYESGIATLLFNLEGGRVSEPNWNADKFVTVYRDGAVVSNLPVSNNYRLTYDSSYADVWQLSLFPVGSSKSALPGNYTVHFDAGFFLLGEDKKPSDEIVLNYTIPAPVFTVDPPSDASGKLYKYESIQDWTITYNNADRIELVSGKQLSLIDMFGHGDNLEEGSGDDETVTPTPDIIPQLTVKGNTLFVHLDKAITKPGTWKLESQPGLVTIYDAAGNASSSPDINLFFFIPKYESGLPEIDPEPGDIDIVPGRFILTLPKGQEVKNVNGMAVCYFAPVAEDGSCNFSKNYIARFKASKNKDNSRQVFLDNWKGVDEDLYPKPGKYRLVTGESLYQVSGNSSYISSMTFDYNVIEVNDIPYTISPVSGSTLTKIDEIKVAFDDVKDLKINYTPEPSTLDSDVTSYIVQPSLDPDNPDGVIFRFNVPATYPGVYEFASASGAIYVDDYAVVVTGKYTISGSTEAPELSDVVVLPAVFDIYDAQGIIIAKDADLRTLRSLPAGLYIAGGKKFINK